MLETIDHVGIAVADLDAAIASYRDRFDMELVHRERIDEHGVELAMLAAGAGRIELVAALSNEAPIARFLDSHGPGMHHLAYRVEDIEATLAQLRERDVELLDERPRPGFGGSLIAFIAPQAVGGVLTEIVERPR